MDEKELQKAVNPIYLTAKGTLSLLYQAKDPDAVAPVRTAWEGSPTLTLPRASVATLRADIGRTDARSR